MYGASKGPKTFQQMMESLKTGGFTQTVGGKKVFTPVMKATKMSGGVPVVQKGYKVPEGFAQTGQMASGQPVYTQMQIQQPTTAAKPKTDAKTETTGEETKVEVTPETKALQDQTADLMKQIEDLKGQIVDPQTIIDKYKEEQAAIQEQQQATAAAQFANQAKSGLAPTLQIGGAASAGPMKTGTSAFKIKKPGTTSTINPLNIGSSSSLNV